MPPVVTPIAVPAVLAGVVLLVSWGAWSRRARFESGHWGGAVAVAGAYLSAHVLLKSWPSFPPERADDWQALAALALGAAGVAQRWWGTRWYTAVAVRLLLSAGLLALLLRSQIEHRWSGPEAWYWLAGLAVAMAVGWQSLEKLASIRAGASLPFSLWALCALAAGTLALAGSAFFAQLLGGLAAAFGAAIVLAMWSRDISVSGGAMTVFVPLYFALVARGYFHAELPVYSAVLLYAAPFALWLGEERRVVYQRPWKAALIRVGLVAAPAAVALLLAYVLVFRAAQNSGYAY